MAQIAAGGVEAFETLYDRYAVRSRAVAGSVCRDAGSAEEAIQEAFASIWRNRASYREQRGTVASWLLCVVRYRAIDIARREVKHAKRRADEAAIESRAAPGDFAERVLERDQSDRLQLLLATLPEAQREVITLAYYGQLTHSEIAAQLALAPGTVKGRMRLGLQKLREEIDQAA